NMKLISFLFTVLVNLNIAYGFDISKDILDKLDRAIHNNPNDIAAYNHAATELNDSHQFKESIKVCQKALKIDSKDAFCYMEISRSYLELGKKSEALKMVEKSIKLDPNNIFALYQKIFVLDSIKPINKKELVKLGYKILEKNSEDKLAYIVLIKSLAGLGKKREMISAAEKYISYHASVVNYLNLANAYAEIGKPDEYLLTIEKAINLDQSDLRPLWFKIQALFHLKRYVEVIPVSNKFLKLQPDNTGVLAFKADALATLARYEEALNTYNIAIETKPKNPTALYLCKGLMLHKLGRLRESVQMYNKVLRLDPKNVSAYNNLGFVLSDMGQNKAAMEAYEKGLKIDPNNQLIQANKKILESK
ncbi:MAG: hypothetical protein COA94_06130, partial [Rickettsiales bacterium]